MRADQAQAKMLLGAVGLIVVFIAGVVLPLRYQRAGYQQRIDVAQKTLGMDLAEARGLVQLNQDVIALRASSNGAQQYVPQEDELADIIRGLSNALSAYGITEREVETKATEHYAKFSVIPITMEFEATFPSAVGVLKDIESMKRLIRVDDMQIERDSVDSQELPTITLSLSTFIARTEAEE